VRIVADVLRALKHHVLEEVREAGESGAFVGRTDVIPEIGGDERQALVFDQNHFEAVLEFILLEIKSRGDHRSLRARRGAISGLR
jgi:hypothetical protein